MANHWQQALAQVTPDRTFGVAMSVGGPAAYNAIQTAVTAAVAAAPSPSASNPYTVLVYPGVYAPFTGSPFVNVKGIGPKGSVIIQATDGTVLTLGTNFTLSDVTLDLTTPTNARNMIIDNGVAVTCKLSNVDIIIDTPSTFAHNVILLSGSSVVTMDKVTCSITGTGASKVLSVTGAATVLIDRGILENDSTSATNSVIDVSNSGASVAVIGGHVESDGGRSIACSAGLVILHRTHYHSIARSGTGNIVDHSTGSQDELWHVFSLNWEIANANANITRRTASSGTINDGGTGQIELHVTTSATSVAGVENNNDVAGTLSSAFNAARTPKNAIQLSIDAFIANNSQFHGMRATLGAAIPPAAENHAGFIWDGTNFKCSSSNGGGVGQTSNLTTPSTGVQHQYQIVVYGSLMVEFYVDGALVKTHINAAGIPSGDLQWQKLNANTGITASAVNVTVRRLYCQECPT